MSNKTNIFTLQNGLRVAIKVADGAVSYIGVAVNAGSRDEDSAHEGLAHFVEHTIFKGTSRRRSWHISNRMEQVGGELNAYTSKEETVVYTNAPAGYAERAIELLADIIARSEFPVKEIDKEREVVIEEINSYLDSPSDSVFDEFEELIYAGSGLAHNILGNPDSVRKLSAADCRGFLDAFYTPENMVLYICDSSDPQKLLRIAEKYFGGLHFSTKPHNRIAPPAVEPFDITRDRDGHQAHTIIGARLFGRKDPRRFPLFLLNNYIGGPCMNSILNQELRERRGLVYTVESNVSLMSDCGIITIYYGTDSDSADRCRRIILNTLDSITQKTLSPRTFEKIKEQYCGQITVSTDNRESMAMSMGKSLLFFDAIHNPSLTIERIREVTAEQFRTTAELLAPALCSRLTLR